MKVFICQKQRKELKTKIAEVVKRREEGENNAIVKKDIIMTFPARRATGNYKPADREARLIADSDNYRTMGNSMKIYKPRLNLSILQSNNFFSVRVVNSWNSSPDDVISAKAVISFKNRLD